MVLSAFYGRKDFTVGHSAGICHRYFTECCRLNASFYGRATDSFASEILHCYVYKQIPLHVEIRREWQEDIPPRIGWCVL